MYDSDAVRKKYPMLFLTQRAPGHSPIGPSLHVDLVEANRRQLLAAGLKPGAIQVVGGCTQCHPELFFSHRASHGHAGRMMAVVGIKGQVVKRAEDPDLRALMQPEVGFSVLGICLYEALTPRPGSPGRAVPLRA